MRARWLCVGLVTAAALAFQVLAFDRDRVLAEGIRLVEEGDFERAIATLGAAIHQMSASPAATPKEMARARVDLAIAYLEQGGIDAARQQFEAALQTDPELVLPSHDFPPKVVAFFEVIRARMLAPQAVASPAKSRSKSRMLLAGAGVATAGVVATQGRSGATSGAPAVVTPGSPSLGAQDFAFLGSSPAPGARVSTSVGGVLVVVTLAVTHDGTGVFMATARPIFANHDVGQQCIIGNTQLFSISAGQPMTISVPIERRRLGECPRFPVTSVGLYVTFNQAEAFFGQNSDPLFRKFISGISYEFVP